ncbi:hypothetical protein Tco_0898734 [Tanacetum coccineum]
MDSDKYLEGQSMQRPPLFESDCFIYWKNRFETYVKAKDLDLWHIILNGDFPPVAKNEVTQILEEVPFEQQDDNLKRKLAKNNEAKMVFIMLYLKRNNERFLSVNRLKKFGNRLIMEYLVKDSKKTCILELKRRYFEDYYSKDQYAERQYIVFKLYGNTIFWKISNVVPTPRTPNTPYPTLWIRLYPDDLKSDKGKDDDKIDMIQSSKGNENAQGSNKLLEESHDK